MAYEFRGPGVAKPPPKKSQRRVPEAPEPVPRERSGTSLLQIFAALFGLAFLLAGVGGFIPGVTSNHDGLETYGLDSTAELVDLFRVSFLHNAVHLLFAVGLVAAIRASLSKLYLLGGGLAYLGVAAYGFVVDQSSDANFLPINDNDNYLHVGLSTAMIVFGLIGVAAQRRTRTSA